MKFVADWCGRNVMVEQPLLFYTLHTFTGAYGCIKFKMFDDNNFVF